MMNRRWAIVTVTVVAFIISAKSVSETCNLKCEHGGTLNNDTCTCNCPGYWQGDKCERCQIECKFGVSNTNNCSCFCTSPWTGEKCENCSLQCEHGGTLDAKACSCACQDPWKGLVCDTCLLECKHGVKNAENCTCDNCEGHWTGSNCDKCSLKCEHGSLQTDTCMCICEEKWHGDTCNNNEVKLTIDCMQHGTERLKTTVKCRIEGQTNSGIDWIRPDGKVVVTCNSSDTNCSIHVPGYMTTFENSESLLIIKSFNTSTDSGHWKCRATQSGSEVACIKMVQRNATLTTYTDCKWPGIPGEKTILSCQVLNGQQSGIMWYRPDGKLVLWCDYSYAVCGISSSVRDRYQGTVTGKYTNNLIIDSFDPKIDSGIWMCQHGFSGVPSACVKQVAHGDCDLHCDHGSLIRATCICHCEENWTGTKCGQCNLRCNHGGYIPLNRCTCICSDNWRGKNCELCHLQCKNGGTLFEDSCTCNCTDTWIGEHCEICNKQCVHGAVRNETCSCVCELPWTGDTCDKCSIQCEHEGVVQEHACKCDCLEIWTGDSCEKCNLKCEHGRLQQGSCTCECDQPWKGLMCDQCGIRCIHGDVDDSQCHCVNCRDYWIGEHCETCGLTCKYGSLFNDTCVCYCNEFWVGDKCDIRADIARQYSGVSGNLVAGIFIVLVLVFVIPISFLIYKRMKKHLKTEDEMIIGSNEEIQKLKHNMEAEERGGERVSNDESTKLESITLS